MTINAARATAMTAYRLGKYDEAYEAARQVLDTYEYDGRMWELLGAIHFERERMNQCVDALERASLCVPLTPENSIRLAWAYGALGSRELSRDLLVEIEQSGRLTLEQAMQVAAGLDSIDLPRSALALCRNLTRKDPDHARLYFDMGYYAVRSGYPPSVVISLGRRAIDLEPTKLSYRIGLALYLNKQGRFEEAIREFDDISEERLAALNCQCCLERMAELFEAAGQESRAVCCRQRLAEISTGDL